MATYAELQQQIAALQAEAERVKREETPGVIARIKEAIAHYDLTAADLGLAGARAALTPQPRGRRRSKGSALGKAAKASKSGAKYGDGKGNVWGGRGPRPRWLRQALAGGKELKEFLL